MATKLNPGKKKFVTRQQRRAPPGRARSSNRGTQLNPGTAKFESRPSQGLEIKKPEGTKLSSGSSKTVVTGKNVVKTKSGQVKNLRTGRVIQERVNVVDDRTGKVGKGERTVIRGGGSTEFRRNRKPSKTVQEQTIGGERIHDTGSTGGQRFVRTESGKIFIEVGKNQFISEPAFRLKKLRDKDVSDEVALDLFARQALSRQSKEQQQLIGALRTPDALIQTGFERIQGKESSFSKNLEQKKVDSVKSVIQAKRFDRGELPSSAQQQVQRDLFFETALPAIDFATTPLLVGKGVTKTPKVAKELRTFSGLSRGGGGIGFQSFASKGGIETVGKFQKPAQIVRRLPRITRTAFKSTVASDKKGIFVSKSDGISLQAAGRSRQRFLIDDIGGGKVDEFAGIQLGKSAGRTTARRIIKGRKFKVSKLDKPFFLDSGAKDLTSDIGGGVTQTNTQLLTKTKTPGIFKGSASRQFSKKFLDEPAVEGIEQFGDRAVAFKGRKSFLVFEKGTDFKQTGKGLKLGNNLGKSVGEVRVLGKVTQDPITFTGKLGVLEKTKTSSLGSLGFDKPRKVVSIASKPLSNRRVPQLTKRISGGRGSISPPISSSLRIDPAKTFSPAFSRLTSQGSRSKKDSLGIQGSAFSTGIRLGKQQRGTLSFKPVTLNRVRSSRKSSFKSRQGFLPAFKTRFISGLATSTALKTTPKVPARPRGRFGRGRPPRRLFGGGIFGTSRKSRTPKIFGSSGSLNFSTSFKPSLTSFTLGSPTKNQSLTLGLEARRTRKRKRRR